VVTVKTQGYAVKTVLEVRIGRYLYERREQVYYCTSYKTPKMCFPRADGVRGY
jgi:hypothetical protein